MDDAVTDDRRERVLMISPYPPVRDGIASYALQTVRALRREGLDVEVLSPGPSAAHHHLDLRGPRGALALAKRIRDYDRVIVQFHPDFFYPDPGDPRSRMIESAALALPFALARRLEVVVHEIDGRHGNPRRPDGQVARRLWHLPESIKVHTASERAAFIADFGVDPARVELIAHGADFRPHTQMDREAARKSLDIEPDAFVFLAIGFVQPSKGFDRALQAFAGLSVAGARLDVVGSVRTDDPDTVRHAGDLVDLAETVDGATVHLGYVSDELFDRWIVAADVVVLPYRNIWSSGVMERAALFDRPVIATRVGGLAEQAASRADVRLVEDDDELRQAMIERLPAHALTPATSWSEDELPEDGDLRAGLQERVRQRASSRSSLTRAARGAGTRGAGTAASVEDISRRSAPLRRLPHVGPPDTNHGRRSVRVVKRLLRKATAFQVDPILHRLNELQDATVVALELEARAAGTRAGTTSQEDGSAAGRPPSGG
ncbi:glycosyltransferase [Blastococcus sp. SYSU D01042]